jgi:PPM family protein phosphatase
MSSTVFRAEGRSDTGPARSHNEDEFICDAESGIYAVIDGMGGQAAGEVAARIAKQKLLERLRKPGGPLDRKVREAIALANNSIFEEARRNPAWLGMGCVLTVAVVSNGRLTVGHVGDSRLYRIRRGADGTGEPRLSMRKLTRDHSPVGEREDNGQLTEEEAIRHPRRNEVFRDVGAERHAPDDSEFIDVIEEPFEADSAFLLCSDGLTDVVRRAGMLGAIRRDAGNPAAVVDALIELANANSKDNVTAVYLEGPKFAATARAESGEPAPPARGRISRLAWPAACLLLAGALAYTLWTRREPPAPRRILAGNGVTMAQALAQARPGDLIDIAPGTYAERVKLTSGVDLIAQTPGSAIVQFETPVVEARGVSNARIIGLKLAPSGGHAAAIEIDGSAVQMLNLEISGAPGAALRFSGRSMGLLAGSYLHHNAGPGVEIADTAEPRITGNFFASSGAGARDPQPSVLLRTSAQPVIRGNWFADTGVEAVWARQDVAVPGLEENFFPPGLKRHIRLLPPLR